MATNRSMNLPKNSTVVDSEILRGRTGVVVKVLSADTAVLKDKIYNEVLFSKDVAKIQISDKCSFAQAFPKNRVVYYDLVIDSVGRTKCTSIWIGSKAENELKEHSELLLKENVIYKTTVKRVVSPFAFVVEENNSKIPIFVCNQAFMPRRHSPKLLRSEPVICYVKEGDSVSVKVRYTPDKQYTWSAWDAWMQDSHVDSKTNKNTKVSKHKVDSTLHGIHGTPVTGKLNLVYHKTALLDSKCKQPVQFHRDDAFLFGIPLKTIRLDRIFSKGDEVNYILSDKLLGEASCVWVGPFHNARDGTEEIQQRINGLIKYCQDKQIDPEIQKTLLQLDGMQQRTEGKNETTEVNKKSSSLTKEQKMKKYPVVSLESPTERDLTVTKPAPGTTKVETGIQFNSSVDKNINSTENGNTSYNEVDRSNRRHSYKDILLSSQHPLTETEEVNTKKDKQNNESSYTLIGYVNPSIKRIPLACCSSEKNSTEFDMEKYEASSKYFYKKSSSVGDLVSPTNSTEFDMKGERQSSEKDITLDDNARTKKSTKCKAQKDEQDNKNSSKERTLIKVAESTSDFMEVNNTEIGKSFSERRSSLEAIANTSKSKDFGIHKGNQASRHVSEKRSSSLEDSARTMNSTEFDARKDRHSSEKSILLGGAAVATSSTEFDLKKDEENSKHSSSSFSLESSVVTTNSTDFDTKNDTQNNKHCLKKDTSLEDCGNKTSSDSNMETCKCSNASSEKSVPTEGAASSSNSKHQFGAVLVNKTVVRCFKKALLKVLTEEFGEETSDVLATDAMNFFKAELEKYMIQVLMKKTLSYVAKKNSDKSDTDTKENSPSSCSDSLRNELRRMYQNWKRNTKAVIEEEKAKNVKRKIDTLLMRAKQFQEKLNSAFSTRRSDDGDTDCSDDEFSDDFDDESTEDCSFENVGDGEDRLINIVQDFMKIQNNELFQTVMESSKDGNKKKECVDNGTQTTSTGQVLFIKYLTDV